VQQVKKKEKVVSFAMDLKGQGVPEMGSSWCRLKWRGELKKKREGSKTKVRRRTGKGISQQKKLRRCKDALAREGEKKRSLAPTS